MRKQYVRHRDFTFGWFAQRHTHGITYTIGKQRPYAGRAFDTCILAIAGFSYTKV